METEDQYCNLLPELRQLLLLSAKPPLLPASDHFYAMLAASGGTDPPLPPQPLARYNNISDTANGGGEEGRVCSSQCRWPRQETMTLLEIRTRLDPQFREAGQKAPLWEEVARIMAEEYGYLRSGRKCREKLDNLYKYYKKTKEGKAGKQDGRHYRFFRQLEALYGSSAATTASTENTTGNPYDPREPEIAPLSNKLNLSENITGLSFSTSTESSGDDEEEAVVVERNSGFTRMKSWKMRIAELVDSRMKRLVEKQEEWFERMLRSMERMEQERVSREESWRKEEAARQERERLLLAGERAWAGMREAALLKALENVIRQRDSIPPPAAAESEPTEEELSRGRKKMKGLLQSSNSSCSDGGGEIGPGGLISSFLIEEGECLWGDHVVKMDY